jgi:hypothetical protein
MVRETKGSANQMETVDKRVGGLGDGVEEKSERSRRVQRRREYARVESGRGGVVKIRAIRALQSETDNEHRGIERRRGVQSVGEGGENARRAIRAFVIDGFETVPKVHSVAVGVEIEF